MSSDPPLQCLFCQQLNPAGASFCNGCGSQLNLQPCEQCGAIDDRAAKNCYKCGAEFTTPTPLEPKTETEPAPATGSRRGTLVAMPALVLALLATTAYFYYGRSQHTLPTQDERQAAAAASVAPMPEKPTAMATVPDAAQKIQPEPATLEACPPAVATLGLCNQAPP